ncbi:MAG: transglycosylase domain-containing protein, partial [Chloroflexota bacterium]|nr:transglycosylase domain-containing protein [Chloroflexota bacterium]
MTELMQTSLARRQRHRRIGVARRPRGGGIAARHVAIAIPLVMFATFLLVGLVGFLGVVTAYAYYSQGLDDPKKLLSTLDFEEQTIVYDRTGAQELARLGDLRRELVSFDEIPPELLDLTTSIEDKDFWENPGFDFGGFVAASIDTLNGRPRGGSTITQQLVRARLLPPEAFEDTVYERKVREIIQSLRLTEEFPGEAGKRQIITAYLNLNFYGNHSYGLKAAAKSYFNKPLADLTLAEAAILAAVPQSPTKFDLTKNAEEECLVELPAPAAGAEAAPCPPDKLRLVVPASTEIVTRRNYVLDRMQQFAVLTKGKYTAADFRKARQEPVYLADQRTPPWKASQFVWQVREQLAAILCPELPVDECKDVDSGGYRVTTTLDMKMQATSEKWTFVAARAPNAKNPTAVLDAYKIPKAQRSWILSLRGHNIHNGAAAIVDYRTGEVLAYVGSASYSAKGNVKFQPKFDVLSQGWRQPGSSIKPLNYIVGIDDHTLTAATMFMDVVTDFGRRYTPKQADNLERGPVRLRSALQFSLNIPAIKAGLMIGLDRLFARNAEFGLTPYRGAIPVVSMSIGTLVSHPIDMLRAYGAIANGGVLMPRTTIRTVVDTNGKTVWSAEENAKGTRVASAQAAYIVTDILAGNTDVKVNPYWGKWAIYDGKARRPAAYKTGTTQDNRDVHAYGFLAPPKDIDAPALAVGIWMGNSNNDPNDGKLSLETSAPLWAAILAEVSKGTPMAKFEDSMPGGLVTASVDVISGLLPGPMTSRTVKELFIEGTVPTRTDDLRKFVDIDEATGLLWQDTCTGPKVNRGFMDFSGVEPGFPTWAKYNRAWAARAARGAYVR